MQVLQNAVCFYKLSNSSLINISADGLLQLKKKQFERNLHDCGHSINRK